MEKFKYLKKESVNRLTKNPGVYCFKKGKEFFYIGKANNLRERVKSHRKLLSLAKQLGFIKTNSEIEALLLEAKLIKQHQPKYNVMWRDDKNYFFIGKTEEDFPRIFITHQPTKTSSKLKPTSPKNNYAGPFVDGKALKQTINVLRKVFPYRSCKTLPKKPCLWYQLGRCPGPCLLNSPLSKQIPKLENKMKKECRLNARNLMNVLKGKKNSVQQELNREMKRTSKEKDYEKAAKIRDQIKSLEKVISHTQVFGPKLKEAKAWTETQIVLQKILKTKKPINRIEAFDVSNIQGELATGSMVTFVKGTSDKSLYRKFKIKIEGKPDDTAMLKEIISRRMKHPDWGKPDLMLIDGGKAQLNAAKSIVKGKVPVIAIAKKKNELFVEKQRKPILLKTLPREIFNLILQLRDEAHRFAISYHKLRRAKTLLKN